MESSRWSTFENPGSRQRVARPARPTKLRPASDPGQGAESARCCTTTSSTAHALSQARRVNGSRTPRAAKPMSTTERPNASHTFWPMTRRVRSASPMSRGRRPRSVPSSATSAPPSATSLSSAPIATPTSAPPSAGASFTPSPTIITVRPRSLLGADRPRAFAPAAPRR